LSLLLFYSSKINTPIKEAFTTREFKWVLAYCYRLKKQQWLKMKGFAPLKTNYASNLTACHCPYFNKKIKKYVQVK